MPLHDFVQQFKVRYHRIPTRVLGHLETNTYTK
jgi:hypothetical protein